MSQLVFQEDITIFENNNFLSSQHRSLAAFPGSARQRCFLVMCAVCSPGLLRLPGFDYCRSTSELPQLSRHHEEKHHVPPPVQGCVARVLSYFSMTATPLPYLEYSTSSRLVLNLRTELFRPLWTRQRSTEKMRPNLIAMEIKISNQARTNLARVLKLTSQ